MDESDLHPDKEIVKEIREEWTGQNDTFGRVYQTLLGCKEYAHADEIADIAGCSLKSAQKHLNRLVQMGVAERAHGYRRNEGYLEWMKAKEIADNLSEEDIIERVRQLESRASKLETEFGSDGPNTASVYEVESDDAMHERMKSISEWRSIERDISLYELARQIIQNDGHLIQR